MVGMDVKILDRYAERGFAIKDPKDSVIDLLSNFMDTGYDILYSAEDSHLWSLYSASQQCEIILTKEVADILQAAFCLPPISNGYSIDVIQQAAQEMKEVLNYGEA